jgi:signal transduction histidine kinase
MNTLKKNIHWLILLIFLLIGGLFFFYLHQNSEKKDIEARSLKLQYQHNRSIDQFASSVDKFAGLVSGMRSYMNMSAQLPSAVDFQQFVKNQYSDLHLQDSIVVSFIDTAHVFKQSFTREVIDPVNLVGKSVSTLRSKEKIQRLDHLMTHDSLQMFPPLNLIEGWVGLPIDFRVHREGTTIGYVAPILSLKSILNDIYEDARSEEFVFHFNTQEGFDFDRERTYNNTQVFNFEKDPEYYKNFDVGFSQFLYSTKSYYGFDITIGTAYKNAYEGNNSFSNLLIFWYLTISLLAAIVTWQVNSFRKLNLKLLNSNKQLIENKDVISDKNQQLQKLNNTQTKFFSIIGHDIKQPLSAIEGLLTLLQYEEINDPDLADIIKSLSKSTKNTTNLLNNLLRWARSQTGDIKFVPADLYLNDILEEVVETLYFQAKEKSIRIIHQPGSELPFRGDKDMLSTIFRNLMSNAIKFTNLGGTVHLETRKLKNTIEIMVTDSGIGMTPEAVNSLFQLDTQISTVGTSGEMGTGLGLILCDLFTKKHGGHILVNSELERGTRFTVVLPS